MCGIAGYIGFEKLAEVERAKKLLINEVQIHKTIFLSQ